ncbi:MAG: hypothetical protein N2450_00005, partial [bacterium]|nr:hypothetical protein [bacterium]
DYGRAITSDGSGGCIITGYTNSWDFPTTPGAYDQSYNGGGDVFITRLNSTGSALIYSTFLGGGDYDEGRAITSDGSGGCIITGSTNSSNFPTTPGAYDQSQNGSDDVFITRLNNTGSALLYSTFLGGSDYDEVRAITSDGSSTCIITGSTNSANFPTTTGVYDPSHNGSYDVFLAKLRVSSIRVLKPNGGEFFQTGMSDTIRWSTGAVVGNVNIELKRNYPTGVWEMLANNVPNTGQYLWTVSGTPSNNCILRISSISDPTDWDISDSLFAIVRPTITVTYPNGGDSIMIGNYINIQWNSSNTTGNFRIDLNRNYPSDSWEVLFPSIPNTGEQYWQVTGPPTTTARFRLTALNNVTACDTSDANFTIYGAYSGLYVYSSISNHNFNTLIAPGMRDSVNVTIRVVGNQPLVGARLVTLSGPFRGSPATLPTVPPNYSTLITLYFEPTTEGTFSGTVALISNALNADTLRFQLTGRAQWQPQVPRNLQITLQGWNANLTWNRVDSTTNGIPITVTGYLVFYSELASGPWYFHGHTSGANATSYTHFGVVRFAPQMYYRVRAWIGSTTASSSSSDAFQSVVDKIPQGTLEEEVYSRLRKIE